MARLFVAIDLPPAVTTGLSLLQPAPATGIKLTIPGQMHVTLHFIGEAEVAPVAHALQAVQAPVFGIKLAALGQFRSRGENIALWAGVQICDELLDLRTSVLAALTVAGLKPEVRAYKPHITLARCKAGVPGHVARDFLAQPVPVSAVIPVSAFALYSSTLTSEGSLYRLEQNFMLQSRPS